MINAVIIIGWEPQSTRFRPLSISNPPPLFPIGGYPIIFHHLKALSNLREVKNVYLMGYYDQKKFVPFIDFVKSVFNFKVHYIQEEIPYNTAGGIFYYKKEILQDNPKHIFIMHCDICCSFPLYDMLKFHEKHNKLATIMTTTIDVDEAQNYGCFIYDQDTLELLYYNEKPSKFISNVINCGVYLFSADMYKMDFYLPHAENYQKIKEINKDDGNEIPLSKFFNEFANQFRINNMTEAIKIKDIIQPLCEKKLAYLFFLDKQKHFWQQVKKTQQLLYTQEIYLKYYNLIDPSILTRPKSMKNEQIEGLVCIHPTALIHSGAKIGPNVTIGAHARIGDGARIKDTIILEDVVIQPHAVVINSIIGWTTVIGSWARIEGIVQKKSINQSQEDEQEGSCHSMNSGPTCEEIQRVLKNGITTIGGGVFVEPELHLRNCVVLPFKNVSESAFHQIIV